MFDLIIQQRFSLTSSAAYQSADRSYAWNTLASDCGLWSDRLRTMLPRNINN